MEKHNVETLYCRSDGPVTRVSSCNPGLRRGIRWRWDAHRRVPRCSSKLQLHVSERRCWCPMRPALGVLQPGVRDVYGRRWSVASLPIKAKEERLSRSSFMSDTFHARQSAGVGEGPISADMSEPAPLAFTGRGAVNSSRGRLAQLVRAPALHAGCRRFESVTAYQKERPRGGGLLCQCLF
jgi:hypothetical protein